MATRRETLHIPDMHCDGCAARITNVLERLEGVRAADVSFETKTAQIEYDDEAAHHGDLTEAVEKAGYTVDAETA